MLIIKNGFTKGGDVIVDVRESNSTKSPIKIPGGGFHQPGTGITIPLTLQAIDQKQGPVPSSFKISPLPDGRSINLSYKTNTCEWKMGQGIKSMIECPTPVNVEIGP